MEEIFELNRVVGSYRVIRVLGSGGMGVVYEAEHLELKVRRALKVFAVGGEHAALHRKRFLSEGKMLAALDHARVVRVHEFDVDAVSGRPYFVMDLVLSPDGRPRTLEDERIAGVEESRAAALHIDNQTGQIAARHIRDPLSLQADARRRGRGHRPHAGGRCTQHHIDGRNL